MRLHPLDVLSNGTEVTIGNKRGLVIGHEKVLATPSGMIIVHTVMLTDVYVRGYWIRLDKPETWKGNYTAIEY